MCDSIYMSLNYVSGRTFLLSQMLHLPPSDSSFSPETGEASQCFKLQRFGDERFCTHIATASGTSRNREASGLHHSCVMDMALKLTWIQALFCVPNSHFQGKAFLF